MYLITGSTGNIGSSVVDVLTQQGHDVRALVRDASRADQLPDGIDIAVGDLDDADSLDAAVQDIDGVFLLQSDGGTARTENDHRDARRQRREDGAAALHRCPAGAEAGDRRGAGCPGSGAARLRARRHLPPTQHADEQRPRLGPSDRQGKSGHRSHRSGTEPCIDPYDIARVAALTLATDGHAGHGYILNGPEALTSREQVEILADVLGRDLGFEDVTPAEYTPIAVAHGMSQEAAEAVQNLNEMFRTSRAGVIADDVENLTGVAPRTFRDWCEAHADAFR